MKAAPKHANTNNSGIYISVDELLALRHLATGIDLTRTRRSSSQMDGSTRSNFRGRGMEFAEVRPYSAGDDIRSIDWRVTARTQTTYTKLFQEEKERPVYIIVDQRASMFFGSRGCFKSVAATKLAAIIGWATLANNDRIGALIFGDNKQIDLRAKRGKHAQLNFLHQLHLFNCALEQPYAERREFHLNKMLREVYRAAKPGSAVFVISDFADMDSNTQEPLGLLARHTDVHLLHISDVLEENLPNNNLLNITDGNITIPLAKTDTSAFHQHFQQRQQQLRNICLSHKMRYSHLSTQHSDETWIEHIFVRAKKTTAKHRPRLSTTETL